MHVCTDTFYLFITPLLNSKNHMVTNISKFEWCAFVEFVARRVVVQSSVVCVKRCFKCVLLE